MQPELLVQAFARSDRSGPAGVACVADVSSTATDELETRSRDDGRQVTLGETATRLTVAIADEGEAVAVLEVANGDHVTLEAGRSGRHQIHIIVTGCNGRSGRRGARGGTSSIPVEGASTVLR